MSESITLQVSEQVLHKARAEAERSGKTIEVVLAEQLERSAVDWETLVTEQVGMSISTPFEAYATAAALEDIWRTYLHTGQRADKQKP
jgi:hypothetical protein